MGCSYAVTRRDWRGYGRAWHEMTCAGGAAVPGADMGVGVAAGRLIPVRVGDIEIEVEAVPATGTEATSGRTAKAAGNVLDAFSRAQDAIIEVARSTAQMIDRAGAAARPDRIDVEFGLKFSASGTVIMAGVAGEASLKVTLGYDVTARPVAEPPKTAAPIAAPVHEPAAGPP
jgi:hypothetical protein